MTDLSEQHHPITAESTAPDAVNAFRLSKNQIHSFHELGYLAGVRILNDSQIELLRMQLDDVMAPEHAYNAILRISP